MVHPDQIGRFVEGLVRDDPEPIALIERDGTVHGANRVMRYLMDRSDGDDPASIDRAWARLLGETQWPQLLETMTELALAANEDPLFHETKVPRLLLHSGPWRGRHVDAEVRPWRINWQVVAIVVTLKQHVQALPRYDDAAQRALDDAEHRGLVQAIDADPESDEPYAVYADWLQARGDPRGDLIALELASSEVATWEASCLVARLERQQHPVFGALAPHVASIDAARLEHILPEGRGHQAIDLPREPGVLTFGRDRENGLVLDGRGVSRTHGRFVRGDAGLEIEDLRSSYGTRVNGERARRCLLVQGDRVEVGHHRFIVHGERPAALVSWRRGFFDSVELCGAALRGEIIADLARNPAASRLRELALLCDDDEEVCHAAIRQLVGCPLAAVLHTLVISSGLSDDAAHELMRARDRFEQLRSCWCAGESLSAACREELARCFGTGRSLG